MLVPTRTSGRWLCRCSSHGNRTERTPISYAPRAPPPDRTRPMFWGTARRPSAHHAARAGRAAVRERSGQGLGDQVGAQGIPGRVVMDAVWDEVARLSPRGPVEHAHVRVLRAGGTEGPVPLQHAVSAYGPNFTSVTASIHITGCPRIVDQLLK